MTPPPSWNLDPVELRKTFGENLRAARLKAGLKQEDLAKAAGRHSTYVSNVEQGLQNVTIETMAVLARVVGRGVTTLLTPKKKRPPR